MFVKHFSYVFPLSDKFRFQNCHIHNGEMSVRNIDFSSETQKQIYLNKKIAYVGYILCCE